MFTNQFFSVQAHFSGRVVARVARGGSVWAWRAPSQGQRPSPACLFIACKTDAQAARIATLATRVGLSALVRRGQACAVWATGPLSSQTPAWAVKIRLPAGMSPSAARAQLRAAWVAEA